MELIKITEQNGKRVVSAREQWKDIPGYEGRYMASDEGRVKSLSREILVRSKYRGVIRERILSPVKRGKGYLSATLEGKLISIHRLVLAAFTGVPINHPMQVNHKNEIKTDNRLGNLEWCDNKYNCCYGSKRNKQSVAASRFRIKQINKEGQVVRVWDNAQKTSADGYNPSHVLKCCKGERVTHAKHQWAFDNSSINPMFIHSLLNGNLKSA